MPLAGRLLIVGVVGVACPTVKLFEEPSAARYSVPAATCAVSVQVPTPTKSTVNSSDSTVQTSVVDEVTEVDPSPSVLTDAVKLPP